MKNLNKANMQVFVHHVPIDNSVNKNVLPDYEGILVGSRFDKIRREPKAPKKLLCPVIGLKVNLYSSTATCRHGKMKILHRKNDEIKTERRRPDDTNQKDDEVGMQLSSLKATDANPFAEKQGAYGKAWA